MIKPQQILKMGALIACMFFSTQSTADETITISGSTSVTEIMEILAETYQSQNKSTTIEVQGTGSSAGVKAAKNGTSIFGMSSRELKPSEKEDSLNATVIARDGIAVVINQKNPVQNLSIEQIEKIYKGEITNWKQDGGENNPIDLVTRDTASGTRGAFEDIMGLKRKINDEKVSAISQRAQVGNGNGVVKTIVVNNPYAIGYISLGSVDNSLKSVRVNGVSPSTKTISSGDYKVARPFLVLSKTNSTSPSANKFLDWVISPEGQKIISNYGYIPVQ